jgi:hypothetical protein
MQALPEYGEWVIGSIVHDTPEQKAVYERTANGAQLICVTRSENVNAIAAAPDLQRAAYDLLKNSEHIFEGQGYNKAMVFHIKPEQLLPLWRALKKSLTGKEE